MEPPTIVIYHRADFDGIFCREIAKRFMPDAILIGWDYGDPVPNINYDGMPADVKLYMLDINVPELMDHPNLVWIDHHKSSIEKYGATGLHDKIKGYRIDGVAACRLAYQWFYAGADSRDDDAQRQKPVAAKQDFIDRQVIEPMAVRLAGEYDIWDKRDPNAELFQHGLRSQRFTDFDWEMMLSMEIDTALIGTGMEQTNSSLFCSHLLNAGKIIQFVCDEEYRAVIQQQGFDVEFDGLKFLACNSHRLDIRSHLFKDGIKPHHEALLGFTWMGTKWSVSMYHIDGHTEHDLSKIAVKHGGGGHRGACGFLADSLPFLK